jgi:hypothetical protein
MADSCCSNAVVEAAQSGVLNNSASRNILADFMVEMAGAAVSAIVLDRGIPEAVKGRILRES